MARSLDVGAFPHLYHDYASDDAAKLGERKLLAPLAPGTKYEDAHFPADGTSLYYDPLHPPRYGIPPAAVTWARLSDEGTITGLVEPVVVNENNGGIVQGALRDRWFLQALGLLHTKDQVKRVLVSSNCKDRGIYTVKFYKSGRWRYVHVDDRIPCGKNGTPHFARSRDPNETWVMIVEKAYAKLHACYEALASGGLEEGLEDVCGRAVERIALDQVDLANDCVVDVEGSAPIHKLWGELADALARHGLVGVCRTRERQARQRPAPDGLVTNHAYTVLEVKHCEADATTEHDYMEQRMICLTTPWRLGAWTGRWCDGHPLWNEYAPIAAQCGMGAESDGTGDPHMFWMEWRDFCGAFDTLVVSREYEGEGARMSYRGLWLPGSTDTGTGGPPSDPDWKENPQYVFDVGEATRFCACLSQEDRRWHLEYPLTSNDLQGIGFSIQHVKGGRRAGKFKRDKIRGGTAAFAPKRQVWAACHLEPGSYALVPASQPPCGVATPLVITMSADKALNFQNTDDAMPDLAREEEASEALDAASAKYAALLSALGAAAQPFPEPAGSELQALWTQTAHLASFMKELKGDCDTLEAKIAELEGEGAK